MQVMHRERVTRSFGLLVAGILVGAMPFFVYAADLSFSPENGSFGTDEEFSVKIMVDPGSDKVNTAEGTVSFDASALSVVSISKDGSVFSLWPADPLFSNTGGTITFSGGTPTPFSTKGAIATIRFTAKKAGDTSVTFSKGSVLAADGKGTDVYKNGTTATFSITEGGGSTENESSDASSGAPFAAQIISSTHPKEDAWYGTSTAVFSWKLSDDITGVRYTFSVNEDAKPDTVLEADATSTILSDLEDGTWYFYLQLRNESGWGEVARKKINIDTVAPNEFSVNLDASDPPALKFQAEDDRSGMDRYEIFFGETNVGSVKATDLKGTHPVPPQEGGVTAVTIKAFDKAGNVREARAELTLPAVAKTGPKGKVAEEEEKAPWPIERTLAIIFALGLGALATLNYNAKKNAQNERMRILQEVAHVRDKNDKIFSAMREEFEQMVNDFDEKPQLTPQERDFLENIKEALDISEELVDSSMEELKKTIRR